LKDVKGVLGMKMVLEEGSLKVVFVITDRDRKWGGEKGFYIGAESNFSPWWGLEVT
jgi:hypothetical protein